MEHLSKPDSRLALSGEEALAPFRTDPQGMLPIYLTFTPDDRDNPRNGGEMEKWYITCYSASHPHSRHQLIYVWKDVSAPGSSSSGAMGTQLHVSAEITTLALSLYFLGLAVGLVLLAPLSGYFGRQPVYVVSRFTLFIPQLPATLPPNIGTILVSRID